MAVCFSFCLFVSIFFFASVFLLNCVDWKSPWAENLIRNTSGKTEEGSGPLYNNKSFFFPFSAKEAQGTRRCRWDVFWGRGGLPYLPFSVCFGALLFCIAARLSVGELLRMRWLLGSWTFYFCCLLKRTTASLSSLSIPPTFFSTKKGVLYRSAEGRKRRRKNGYGIIGPSTHRPPTPAVSPPLS